MPWPFNGDWESSRKTVPEILVSLCNALNERLEFTDQERIEFTVPSGTTSEPLTISDLSGGRVTGAWAATVLNTIRDEIEILFNASWQNYDRVQWCLSASSRNTIKQPLFDFAAFLSSLGYGPAWHSLSGQRATKRAALMQMRAALEAFRWPAGGWLPGEGPLGGLAPGHTEKEIGNGGVHEFCIDRATHFAARTVISDEPCPNRVACSTQIVTFGYGYDPGGNIAVDSFTISGSPNDWTYRCDFSKTFDNPYYDGEPHSDGFGGSFEMAPFYGGDTGFTNISGGHGDVHCSHYGTHDPAPSVLAWDGEPAKVRFHGTETGTPGSLDLTGWKGICIGAYRSFGTTVDNGMMLSVDVGDKIVAGFEGQTVTDWTDNWPVAGQTNVIQAKPLGASSQGLGAYTFVYGDVRAYFDLTSDLTYG